MNGVLIIDKPSGLTSHDVVARVRRILKQKAVGHLGTLDPLATGVLPLVLGNMTRIAQFYLASEKSYEGVIRFGFATDTYDAEGERISGLASASEGASTQGVPSEDPAFSMDEIRGWGREFHGKIQQMPPPFSAKKIHGVPAYKLARKKKEVVLEPVQVEIKQFDIVRVDGPRAHFVARVASGTYMRVVAHEMGQLAGCGAHLESLRRTAVAEFDLKDAHTLERLEEAVHGVGEEAGIEDLLIHPRLLLPSLPSVTATDEMASHIRNGRPVNLPEFSRARDVKVFYGQRNLIAISTRVAGTLFRPRIVLV
jgi:tRNA pseudouridine55 synthase